MSLLSSAFTAADYKWSMRGLDGTAKQAAKLACHNRSAERLRDLCFANGGIYIKFGQHVAQLVSMLLPARASQIW